MLGWRPLRARALGLALAAAATAARADTVRIGWLRGTNDVTLGKARGTSERAVAAGCTVTMPVALQFWGDRYGSVKDPYGVHWGIGSTPA